MISGTNIMKLNPGGSNSYLLKGKEGYLLVDTGMKGAAKKIKNQLVSMDIEPGDIKHILISHDHYDHTGGLDEVRQLTGAMVMIHEDEMKDNSSYKNRSNLFSRVFVKIFGMLTPEGKPKDKIKPDILITGDMDLHGMGYPAKLIHTPGHTPGSVCMITDNGQCIAGDTLFNIFPGTYYPIIVYDRSKLAHSYRRLEAENCSEFYTGHGEPIKSADFKKRILDKGKYMGA